MSSRYLLSNFFSLAAAVKAGSLPILKIAGGMLVPFKATATGVAGPPPSGTPPRYMEVYGAGVATHMGKVAVFQSHFVTPTSDPYLLDFSGGVFVWTAANGNELQGTYSGQLRVISEVLSEIHGTFVIDGDAGRFQSATEGGSASGIQSLVDGSAVLILEGSSSY